MVIWCLSSENNYRSALTDYSADFNACEDACHTVHFRWKHAETLCGRISIKTVVLAVITVNPYHHTVCANTKSKASKDATEQLTLAD